MSVSDTTLVIMAGGLGTRFGGVKQLAEVGPAGEAILDFTIRDARSAGVERIVVIARSDIDDDLRRHLLRHHGSGLDLEVVHQDAFGPARPRPWGTGHAVAVAATLLEGPALVLNADDYYGPTGVESVAFAVAADDTRAVMLCRSSARRAGKVSRSRWSPDREKKDRDLRQMMNYHTVKPGGKHR